ncbi:MAG: hypothetical protein ACUZ8H_01185 [Candidatus Anammoxibacter sp.]
MQVTRYSCTNGEYESLINNLIQWFNSAGYRTQKFKTEDNGILIQAAKYGLWRKFVGMSTTVNVALHHSGSTVTVETGVGSWLDKALVGAVSFFIVWPLGITTACGVWQQAKLPERVNNVIARMIKSG